MSALRVVGRSPNRVGGYERVTGQYDYVADIRLPDVLQAKLVTLDCARARIISIDSSEALKVPGVTLAVSAADLPQPVPRFGPQFRDRPVLATGETKYHGEPVAAVAAETIDAAEEAARLVRVQYEELPAVVTLPQALAPGAPLVREPELRPGDPLADSNVLREHLYERGDVEAAASGAETIIENTYNFPMVTQFPIEPLGFMAAPDDGGIRVWSSIQHPYWLQKIVAEVLGLPLAKVRVIAPDPGGAFGGKQHAKLEPLVSFMALRAQRPVRLILSLEETFQSIRRAATEIRVRTGLRSNGELVFQDVEANYLIGAYADIADRVVGKGSYIAVGPYNVTAARILSRSVLSHTVPSTAFRGFGAPQAIWAVESALNEAAWKLGIDPLELRLRNLAQKGDEFIPGETPVDGEWAQAVQKAAEMIDWHIPPPPGRGRGIALGIKSGPTTGLSYSTVRLLADGSVIVYAGTSDMGQGARTIFAQMAAEELGAPIEKVSVVMGDTAVVPYDQQTSASRSTVLMGNAIIAACREIRDKLRRRAADAYGLSEEDIEIERGTVRLPDGEKPLEEVLVVALGRLGGELVGHAESRKHDEPGHPLSGSTAFFEFNCTAVEAEVDDETGDIVLHRYVTVSDVGKAINPLQVRGQDEGAAIQGLGHTLMEHYIFDEQGRIRNLGAIDYRIPTSMDLPLEMGSEVIENADGPGPHGAKGMSEGALLPVAPAVAAAVREACGVVIRDLPLTPERVWRALQQEKSRPAPPAKEVAPAPEGTHDPAEIAAAGTRSARSS